MTVSVRVVCVGNTEGDQVSIRHAWGKPSQLSDEKMLARGDVSAQLSCGSDDSSTLWLRIKGWHGDGAYKGEIDVSAGPRHFDVDPPADDLDHVHDFGWALGRLKAGYKVHRSGWNGKGMYVYLCGPEAIHPDYKGEVGVGSFLTMHTAQGMEQPGWLISQPDALAEDWAMVERAQEAS